jgi:hypothetical protein
MNKTRVLRPVGAAVAALALIAPFTPSAEAQTPIPKTGKSFAAYNYHWYPLKWKYTFENRQFPPAWHKVGHGDLGQGFGMLRMTSAGNDSVSALLTGHAARTGRWELRFRTRRLKHSTGANYTALIRLVPARAKKHCGAQDIDFGIVHPGTNRIGYAIHTLPNRQFTYSVPGTLRDDYWHTYGIEVTPKRISWFVDGKVRATERRSAALSHILLAPELTLQAQPGQRMHQTLMNVDTYRYFTLKHPDSKSIKAPQPYAGTYRGAC